jgi:uncharacterized protein YlzI (FlbEa/FlbD family)
MLVIDKILNNLSSRIINTKNIALYYKNTTLLILEAIIYKEDTSLKLFSTNKLVSKSSIYKLESKAAEFSKSWSSLSILKKKKKGKKLSI